MELIIAAMAVVVWRYSEPGLVSTVCVMLIVVCSVGTLLVLTPTPYCGTTAITCWPIGWRCLTLRSGHEDSFRVRWRRWLLGEPRQDDPLLGRISGAGCGCMRSSRKMYLLAGAGRGLRVVLANWPTLSTRKRRLYRRCVVAMAGLMVRPIASAVKMAANPLGALIPLAAAGDRDVDPGRGRRRLSAAAGRLDG